MKGQVILSIVLSFAVFQAMGCGVQHSEFARFQDRVQMGMERNEAALDSLKAALDSLQNDISHLYSRLEKERQSSEARDEKYVRSLADLNADLETLKRDVSALSALIDENKHFSQKSLREIEALKKELDGLRKDLSSQVGDMEGKLSGKINEVEGKLKGKIADLEKGKLQDLEMAIADLRQAIPPVGEVQPTAKSSTVQGKPSPQAKMEPQKKPVQETTGEDLRYREARALFEEGYYKEAREAFGKFLKEFPNSKLADNAQYWIGECFYREGAYEKAIVEYEKVITNYPKGEKVPSALLKQAMAFEKLGDKESARFLYQKLIRDFPNTSQAARASSDLNRLK